MSAGKGQETVSLASEQPRPPTANEKYGAKEKLFGPAAERISREEYDTVVTELTAKAAPHFKGLEPPGQLTDKESFGDIDLIAFAEGDTEYDEEFFRSIFGENLLAYHHGKASSGKENVLHTLLVRLASGKQIQVDVTQARDEEDFERKKTFYSKGHLSSFIGVVAKNLGFTYGTEGFFKKYLDSKGQWHNILVTGDLKKGLQILGYDLAAYESVSTLDECAAFLTTSSYFDNRYLNRDNMVRRDREDLRRIPQQRYIKRKLLSKDKRRTIEDEGKLLEELDKQLEKMLPQEYQAYNQEVGRIEAEIAERTRQRRRRLKALKGSPSTTPQG
jgi:hypothetical protein